MDTLKRQSETDKDCEFLKDIPDDKFTEEAFGNVYDLLEESTNHEVQTIRLIAAIKMSLLLDQKKSSPEEVTASTRVIINAILDAKEMMGFIAPDMIAFCLRERKDKITENI